MKDIKKYITEGFFSNVGADNHINKVIELIKDASMGNKCWNNPSSLDFGKTLEGILKKVESDLIKGKLILTYSRTDGTCKDRAVKISLTMFRANDPRWQYESGGGMHGWDANTMARMISNDLLYETKYPTRDESLHHSIAKTIKIEEFKVSK